MKRQGRKQPYTYSSFPQVVFGENYSLMLVSVTPQDSGSYECAINANIGGRNRYEREDLVVNGELLVYVSCYHLPQRFDSGHFQSNQTSMVITQMRQE